jgi:DNA-binding YbaB/EbfC family protein
MGGMNLGGGMNMNNLMKQAQKMQKQLEEMQAELDTKEFEVTSGGGAVKVVITGKRVIKEIKIAPEAVDPDDVETLEDLILTSVNESIRKATEAVESAGRGIMPSGFNFPGGLM